jgi:hypothetical protein
LRQVIVIADLDTLLIALYVELTDRIIPSAGLGRGDGQPRSWDVTACGATADPDPPDWAVYSGLDTHRRGAQI